LIGLYYISVAYTISPYASLRNVYNCFLGMLFADICLTLIALNDPYEDRHAVALIGIREVNHDRHRM